VKVPIDEVGCLDLDAPDLVAYETAIDGGVRWVVWCDHCERWHDHGPAPGHREAHCGDRQSPYWKSGYNLSYSGKWRDRATTDQ